MSVMAIYALGVAVIVLPLLATIARTSIRKGEWEGWVIAWATWVLATVLGNVVGLPDSVVVIFGILPTIVAPIIALLYIYGGEMGEDTVSMMFFRPLKRKRENTEPSAPYSEPQYHDDVESPPQRGNFHRAEM